MCGLPGREGGVLQWGKMCVKFLDLGHPDCRLLITLTLVHSLFKRGRLTQERSVIDLPRDSLAPAKKMFLARWKGIEMGIDVKWLPRRGGGGRAREKMSSSSEA